MAPAAGAAGKNDKKRKAEAVITKGKGGFNKRR